MVNPIGFSLPGKPGAAMPRKKLFGLLALALLLAVLVSVPLAAMALADSPESEDPLDLYDENDDGVIDGDEFFSAVLDHLDGRIDRALASRVWQLWRGERASGAQSAKPTSSTTRVLNPSGYLEGECSAYDANDDNVISRDEAFDATDDYFAEGSTMTLEEVQQVVDCYDGDPPPPPVPGIPDEPTLTAENDEDVTASWRAVTHATSYRVRIKVKTDTGWLYTTSVREPTREFGGLASGTYHVQAMACNPAWCGEWSPSGEVPVGPPYFKEGDSADREVLENTAAGTDIGRPVSAMDPNGDALTYSLSDTDTDAGSFTIDRSSGQVRTSAALDYETKSTYTVTAQVTDGKDSQGNTEQNPAIDDTIVVTIRVTDENEPPVVDVQIADQALRVGGSSTEIDLPDKFSDPDDDVLRYTAVSSNTGVATESVSGSSLTITPVGEGAATVTVTAYDRPVGGLSVSQTVTVTVRPRPVVNNRPVVDAEIADQTLRVGGDSTEIDLSDKFSDPDDDVLRYTAVSSNTGVATESVSGGSLTITPVGEGTATVTVTAHDRPVGGLSVSQTVTVTVRPRPVVNNRPVVDAEIADQTLRVGGDSTEIDLSDKFSDPDDDVLRYTAVSSNTGVATESVSGSSLTITPVGEGAATVTVTAYDRPVGGLSVSQTVTVTVRPRPVVNNRPVVDAEIADQTLRVGGGSTEIDLSDKFSDPDDDVLRYTAVSSNTGVATESVSGSSLTITPVGEGAATVTVTAYDRPVGGLSVSQSLTVTVTTALLPPPVPTGLDATASGTTSVELSWSSVSGVARHRVERRTGTAGAWTTVTSLVTGTTYRVGNLTPSTTYHFRVRAYGDGETYAAQWSSASGTDSATTNTPRPGKPTNVQVKTADGMITLDWSSVPYARGYEIHQWNGVPGGAPGEGDWLPLPSDQIKFSGSSATISGLVNGTSYAHRIRSKNSAGTSGWTDPIITQLPLLAPTELDVTPLPERKASLSWMTPSGNPSGTNYQVRVRASGGTWEDARFNNSKTIELDDILKSDDGLANAGTYEIRVKTTSGSATVYSKTIKIIDSPIISVNGDSSLLQGPPAQDSTAGRAIVTWKRQQDATSYTLRWRKLGLDANGRAHSSDVWQMDGTSLPGGFDGDDKEEGISSSRTHFTIQPLDLREIYAVQLSYLTDDGWVFSARDAYVWPAT